MKKTIPFLILLALFIHNLSMASSQQPKLQEIEPMKICGSHKKIVLIDIFQSTSLDFGVLASDTPWGGIDIDGDQIPDTFHGDFVARIFRQSSNKLLTYGIREYSSRQIETALGNIAFYVESGQMEKPAALIAPFSHPMALESIQQNFLSPKDQTLSLNNDNIGSYGNTLFSGIKERFGDHHHLYRIYRMIQKLKTLGIPLFFPAGNEFSEAVNVAGLAGGIAVGALSYKSDNPAPYSNQNSSIHFYREGDIIGRKTPKGIDINNDGLADFFWSELSGQKSLAELHSGSYVSLLEVNEARKRRDEEFFMSSLTFNRIPGNPSLQWAQDMEDLYGEVILYPSATYFRYNKDGSLRFDPAGDKDPNQVSYNGGSSFAIGNLCQKQK